MSKRTFSTLTCLKLVFLASFGEELRLWADNELMDLEHLVSAVNLQIRVFAFGRCTVLRISRVAMANVIQIAHRSINSGNRRGTFVWLPPGSGLEGALLRIFLFIIF